MPDLNYIRAEMAQMRIQVIRQKREIRDLEECGISTVSAVAFLQRMEAKVESLRTEQDRLVQLEKINRPTYPSGKRILGTPRTAGPDGGRRGRRPHLGSAAGYARAVFAYRGRASQLRRSAS